MEEEAHLSSLVKAVALTTRMLPPLCFDLYGCFHFKLQQNFPPKIFDQTSSENLLVRITWCGEFDKMHEKHKKSIFALISKIACNITYSLSIRLQIMLYSVQCCTQCKYRYQISLDKAEERIDHIFSITIV